MIGEMISHYRIVEKLGEGGMGVVYKAVDIRLQRPVALKFLATHFLGESEEISRFKEEACAASSLNHPNICTIYDIDEEGGQWFIVMEYLDGETLAERLARGTPPLEDALEYAAQTCEALSAAQKRGIVHGDVKPSNLFLTKENRVKLLDFGLSKVRAIRVAEGDRTERLKPSDTISGTLKYMSPEQARGLDTDHRSDIFSFGVLFYEMVSGQRPFDGETTTAILSAILTADPPPVNLMRPEVPEDFQRVIHKCLRKDPRLRHQNADEILEEIQLLRESLASPDELPAELEEPISASPDAAGPRRRSRKTWWIGTVSLTLVAAVAYLLVGGWPRIRRVSRHSPPSGETRLASQVPEPKPEAPEGGAAAGEVGPVVTESNAVDPEPAPVISEGASEASPPGGQGSESAAVTAEIEPAAPQPEPETPEPDPQETVSDDRQDTPSEEAGPLPEVVQEETEEGPAVPDSPSHEADQTEQDVHAEGPSHPEETLAPSESVVEPSTGTAPQEFDFEAFWREYSRDFPYPEKFSEHYSHPEGDLKWYSQGKTLAQPSELKLTAFEPLDREGNNVVIRVDFQHSFKVTQGFLRGRLLRETASEVWVINLKENRIIEVRKE